MRFSFADGTKVTLQEDNGVSVAVELDYTKKRVYTFVYHSTYDISSCDYDGKNKKSITRGTFNVFLLRVFRDSLYFLVKNNQYHINQMNVSNGNIYRSILVNKTDYYDLLVVDSTLQPMGKLLSYNKLILECSVQLSQRVLSTSA